MKPMPRIEGEVQRYQIGPDGDEWVKADDYAALNDYAALVQMERDSARTEIERLRADLERAVDLLRKWSRWHGTDADTAEWLKRVLESVPIALSEGK